MPKRRQYTPEEHADIAARFAAGQTQAQVARETGIPQGTVAHYQPAGMALAAIDSDYTAVVLARAKIYAAKAWTALDVQLGILGDRAWLEKHGEHVFNMASAHRVLAETLGRILAATNRGDDDE